MMEFALKILCVCKANLNLSPRAASVCETLFHENGLPSVAVMSAGTKANRLSGDDDYFKETFGVLSPTQLTQGLIDFADVIVALDSDIVTTLAQDYEVSGKTIVNLEIPDRYSLREGNLESLYEILRVKLEPYVKDWAEKINGSCSLPNHPKTEVK